jgi:hypothetical protein
MQVGQRRLKLVRAVSHSKRTGVVLGTRYERMCAPKGIIHGAGFFRLVQFLKLWYHHTGFVFICRKAQIEGR